MLWQVRVLLIAIPMYRLSGMKGAFSGKLGHGA